MASPHPIYLDANGSAPATPEAIAAYRMAAADFGNPSSSHPAGQAAATRLAQARASVARAIGALPTEIVFTSGGTESNALALLGVVNRARRLGDKSAPRIVTTTIEHPSVARTIDDLEERGLIRATRVAVDRSGRVQASAVLDAIDDDVCLVSLIAASNQTGVIQPIAQIAAGLETRGVLLHSDAVQAAGRIGIDVKDLGVDLLSISGHKLGAVGGIGALYIKDGVEIDALLAGGGQEGGRRASTENVAGAASLAAALRTAPTASEWQKIEALRDRLEAALGSRLAVEVIGDKSPRLVNTSCIRFIGCPGDGLMMALDTRGIAISTGSACTSGSPEPPRALLALGMSAQEAGQTVRISLHRGTTSEEIDRLVQHSVEVAEKMSLKKR